jgi:hypothetical protein
MFQITTVEKEKQKPLQALEAHDSETLETLASIKKEDLAKLALAVKNNPSLLKMALSFAKSPKK